MKRAMRVAGEILVAALLLLAANEAWLRAAKPAAEMPSEVGVPMLMIESVRGPRSWRM